MKLASFSTIVVMLIFIIGAYVALTDQVQGNARTILIIFVSIIGIYIFMTLSIFQSFDEVLDSPKPGNQAYTYSTLKPVTQDYSISTWIYVNDWNFSFGSAKTVLSLERPGANPTQFVLDEYANNLNIKYDTYSSDFSGVTTDVSGSVSFNTTTNTITVQNINIQKWVNIVVCFGKKTDTYINGKLVDTYINTQPIYQPSTQGALTIAPGNVGFSGSISGTRYYNYYLAPDEVWSIYKSGFSNNLMGNFLNRYNMAFTFYQDSQPVNQLFIL
jgi:hypothetical protein